MTPEAHLEVFYSLLRRLATAPSQGRPLVEYDGRTVSWPRRGLYFFLEAGEYRKVATTELRVVRVGTHAVGTGAKSTLWGRLRAHRGDKKGGGNHRGSIFRLHVGAALLAAGRKSLPTWAQGSSASRRVKDSEYEHERLVSDYLGRMRVLWVGVADEPGPRSHRAVIERNAIALLSNNLNPIDRPSSSWLGRHSPRPEIVSSGLWNLNHVRDPYDPVFLELLDSYVTQATG